MKILIAHATRHGSTAEIAERLADRLRAAGHDVDIATAEPGRWLDDEHEGYIVGSAVYLGRWLRGARQFLDENASVLRRHPVWLFSSGPTGADQAASVRTRDVARLIGTTGARAHAVFGGRLDRSTLGPFERAVTRAVRAPYGDFRDWAAIDAWAAEIAGELARLATQPAR